VANALNTTKTLYRKIYMPIYIVERLQKNPQNPKNPQLQVSTPSTPLRPLVPEDLLDLWEERAAIMDYDGGRCSRLTQTHRRTPLNGAEGA
jgi:hypothetical protein